jgi:hypothetical protein
VFLFTFVNSVNRMWDCGGRGGERAITSSPSGQQNLEVHQKRVDIREEESVSVPSVIRADQPCSLGPIRGGLKFKSFLRL